MERLDDNTPFSPDVIAIQEVLEQLILCWNRGDGIAYGECFTQDADYIDITGTHSRGRDEIAQLHQFLFNGPLKGSQLEANVYKQPEVTFLAPTVALIVGGGSSRLAGQEKAPDDHQSVSTTVLVKRDGQWHIRAFQNNRVQPRPFPADLSGAPLQRGEV
jgi:uncharacterized protein (TIGR02246 family)